MYLAGDRTGEDVGQVDVHVSHMVFSQFCVTHSMMLIFRLPPATRSQWIYAHVAIVIVAVLLSACSRKDKGVTISGDVEGLDTLGLRGERLLAEADKAPPSLDSIRAAIDERMNRSEGAGTNRPLTPEPVSTGNPMADRARALGDSMARASANRFSGTAGDENGTGGDTVRGIVTLIGSDPAKQVVLRTLDGKTTITLSGMVTTGMSRLEGVDLMVRGVKISPRDIVVASYTVRAAGGVPVFDGILNGGDGGWSLTLTDGGTRKRLATLPSALREYVGQRVWVAIKPGVNTVESFGVITR